MSEQENVKEAIQSVEVARKILLEAQADDNLERLQKANQQLLLAQQEVLAIDFEKITEDEQQQMNHTKELLKHLLETNASIQAL
jgi:hypothetical protein